MSSPGRPRRSVRIGGGALTSPASWSGCLTRRARGRWGEGAAGIEVSMPPGEYKRRLRAEDRAATDDPPDAGNRAVNFRGEKRGNATHRSLSDPDCRFVSKGASGTGAYPGYTVNALMENRHRVLLGLDTEIFRSSASETTGCLALLQRAKRRWQFTPATLGADKGFFVAAFIEALFARGIEPHIAAE